MKLDKILLAIGIILVAYAIFSRFYGTQCVALGHFKSSSFLLLGNTIMILAVFAKK